MNRTTTRHEGNRARKIIENRYYISDYEVYTKTTNGTIAIQRETLHINDDKQKVAIIDDDGTTKTIRYQYTNHLDSASLELDETGDIITYEEYHPFGTTSYRSGRNEVDVSLKRYKYVHKELDNESGLYYYGMRYYAAWIARFVSVDPLQFDYPHYTPFQYAGNKPVSFIDLDGAEEASVHKYAKTLKRFNSVLKKWDKEASKTKYLNTEQIAYGMEVYNTYENKNKAKFRIFAHDITAKEQIINSIGSYNKSFGKFINVGLPLDLKHFINYANLSFNIGEFITKKTSIHREYRQSIDNRKGGRTSAFTPEDVLSNYLGSYFGSDLKYSDDFVTELGIFLDETRILFMSGNLDNGKYLTKDRIIELKDVVLKYYKTSDLTKFTIGNEIYKLKNIKMLNDEAEERISPIYKAELKLEYILDLNEKTGYKKDSNKIKQDSIK